MGEEGRQPALEIRLQSLSIQGHDPPPASENAEGSAAKAIRFRQNAKVELGPVMA
jgi:hypothetical protein